LARKRQPEPRKRPGGGEAPDRQLDCRRIAPPMCHPGGRQRFATWSPDVAWIPYHARMDRWAVEIGVGLGALTVARRALIAAAVNGVAREGDCFFRRNRCSRFHGAVRAVRGVRYWHYRWAVGWVESRRTDGPVPTASALFEDELAADPVKRPIGSVVSRKAKPRAAKSCFGRLG
jgi:hypothetical protein